MVTLENKTETKRVLWPHWLAAMEVLMLSIVVGMVGGWTSPYLAKLTNPDAVLSITEDEASWVAATLSIGRIGGAIFGAVIVDYFGTKSAVHYTGIPHALSWLLLMFANSVWVICVARILGGFGVGMYFSTFPLYMGEISNPKIRGTLVSLIAQGLPLGVSLGNIVGAYTPMWLFSCISLVPNLAFLCLFMAMPDSPHDLIRRGNLQKAKESLEWYNRGVDVTPELHPLQEFVLSKKSVTYRDKIRQLFAPANRKAVKIVTIVFIFTQLSGLWTTTLYMEIILKNAGVTVIEPSVVVIIVGSSGIIAGWASMWMNDKCGRKFMLATSCFGVALSYVFLGLDYQLLDSNLKIEVLMQWLPIVSVILYACSICIGITPVPSTLMSELFSPDVKSTALAMANVFSSITASITSKTYQPMVDLMDEQYVFWLYGALMIFLAVYAIIAIPETKGKSLQEIQQILTKKKLDPTDLKSAPKSTYDKPKDMVSLQL